LFDRELEKSLLTFARTSLLHMFTVHFSKTVAPPDRERL
jgi:hypothetical protein